MTVENREEAMENDPQHGVSSGLSVVNICPKTFLIKDFGGKGSVGF